jgi:hypothetical protein
MLTDTTWSDWFIDHESNNIGKKNLLAFSNSLSLGASNKLQSLVKEIDTDTLAAYASRKIMILQSPKNFGGTRTRPDNKVICMLGS